MAERPHPPHELESGYGWAARPARQWKVLTGRRCRADAGAGRRACGQPSVAAMNRGRTTFETGARTDSWWAYCAEHMYGRWVEGDEVMQWIVVEVEAGDG